MYCIVASDVIANPLYKMKTTRAIIVVGACLLAGIVRFVEAATSATASEANVLEMNSAPNGHFLVNLQMDRRDRLANFEVKDNTARCVNSEDARLKGLQGTFQLIGNGVFLIYFQNEHHRASQFWVFRKDGSAAVKEIPDRGEKQTAVPVKDDSLEAPKEQGGFKKGARTALSARIQERVINTRTRLSALLFAPFLKSTLPKAGP